MLVGFPVILRPKNNTTSNGPPAFRRHLVVEFAYAFDRRTRDRNRTHATHFVWAQSCTTSDSISSGRRIDLIRQATSSASVSCGLISGVCWFTQQFCPVFFAAGETLRGSLTASQPEPMRDIPSYSRDFSHRLFSCLHPRADCPAMSGVVLGVVNSLPRISPCESRPH